MRLGLLATLIVGLSSCSTIYFHNGQPQDKRTTIQRTHHIMAFDLVEVSPPVDLRAECSGKDWRSVKSELTFKNGLIAAFTEPIYGPWTVGIKCSE